MLGLSDLELTLSESGSHSATLMGVDAKGNKAVYLSDNTDILFPGFLVFSKLLEEVADE